MSRSSFRRAAIGCISPVLLFSGAGIAAAERPPARKEAAGPPEARRLEEGPIRGAVEKGLGFLAKNQTADGSWPSSYPGASGVTSVALLAFLSAGHTPGRGPYGEAIQKGLRWVLSTAGQDGFLAPPGAYRPMYSHGIGTLLLGEVAGMVDENREGFTTLRKVHEKAIELILRAQAVPKVPEHAGGWRYLPDSIDSDISATGWQLMALRAAQDNGISIPKKSIDAAVGYILRCSVPAGFAYQPAGEATFGRTGTAVLAIQLSGEFSSPEALRGGDLLLQLDLKFEGRYFFYGLYYATQAMYQLGGKHWEGWRPKAEAILLGRQGPDGSWGPTADGVPEDGAGRAYLTGMAIQTLTVPFRYLPIYQR